VSEREHEENIQTSPSPVTLRGLISPRTQIVLIAVGIALFNAVLIGILVYIIVVY
jgi:hypothetical protein